MSSLSFDPPGPTVRQPDCVLANKSKAKFLYFERNPITGILSK